MYLKSYSIPTLVKTIFNITLAGKLASKQESRLANFDQYYKVIYMWFTKKRVFDPVRFSLQCFTIFI